MDLINNLVKKLDKAIQSKQLFYNILQQYLYTNTQLNKCPPPYF